MPRQWRITVLISGGGTNLGAILKALDSTLSDARVVHVISNRKDAGGLRRAKDAGIPTTVFSPVTYKNRTGNDRSAYDAELANIVRGTHPDLVVLAGFMLILSPNFLDNLIYDWAPDSPSTIPTVDTPGPSPYPEFPALKPIPAINLHPSLPNDIVGAHAIDRAFHRFKEDPSKNVSGLMIHRVISELDAGAPVHVVHVHLEPEDTLDLFETRMHESEWAAIVQGTRIVLDNLAAGKWAFTL